MQQIQQRSGIPNLCLTCHTELKARESGDERGMLYWCANGECEEFGYEHDGSYYIKADMVQQMRDGFMKKQCIGTHQELY